MVLTIRGMFGLPRRESIPTMEEYLKDKQHLVNNNFHGGIPWEEKIHKETFHKERV
jgi:hypothetical protein